MASLFYDQPVMEALCWNTRVDSTLDATKRRVACDKVSNFPSESESVSVLPFLFSGPSFGTNPISDRPDL